MGRGCGPGQQRADTLRYETAKNSVPIPQLIHHDRYWQWHHQVCTVESRLNQTCLRIAQAECPLELRYQDIVQVVRHSPKKEKTDGHCKRYYRVYAFRRCLVIHFSPSMLSSFCRPYHQPLTRSGPAALRSQHPASIIAALNSSREV